MLSKINLESLRQEIKETFSLSVPLIASQLIYASSGFIGTALIARLGEDALAASVLVSTLWMSLSVLFFGVLNAISVLVAHQYGAKNTKAISEIMGQSFILGVLVTILIMVILALTPFLFRFTNQPEIVIRLSIEYLHALLWTVPALILLIIYEQFLAGINRTKFVLRISLFVVPIEIPIIYVLIFGKFGLPKCGVAGIGYGFAITYTLTALVLTIYFLRSKFYRSFHMFNFARIHWHYLKELIKIGLPIGFMHVVEVSTFAVMTLWIARFGTTLLAAHQIVLQFLGFIITLVFATSQAVTVRVGHAVGRLDLTGIHYAVHVGMGLSFISVVIVAIAFWFIPNFFIQMDINIQNPANALLVKDSAMLLGISAVMMLFDNFRIIGFGALRGLKDTKFPMYASLIAFWIVGLGAAFVLGFYFNWQGAGIWWGVTVGIAFGGLLLMLRMQYILNRLNVDQLKRMF